MPKILLILGLTLLLATLLTTLGSVSAFAEEATESATEVSPDVTESTDAIVEDDLDASNITVFEDEEGDTTNPVDLSGWQEIDGDTYYYDPITFTPVKDWQKIEGSWYYFALMDGKMFTGLLHYRDGGWFYLDPDNDGKMHTGWLEINGATYYFRDGDSGRAYTQWFKTGGYWYFFDLVTAQEKTGWVKNNGGWYYLNPSDGHMLTGWQKLSDTTGEHWFYFRGGDSGRMHEGWLFNSGGWYYLQYSSGHMLTGWQKLADSRGTFWFYFRGGDSGRMLTGWQYISGKWEFFSTVDGDHIRTGGPGHDYAYVEVNLSKQKLWYVKNGKILLESDVVTGNYGSGTPAGAFVINSRVKGTTLVGPGYAAPVSYWMPFVGNAIGFHDATWQPWFGGSRYMGGGSHGCVNMPMGKAKDLYNLCSTDDSVVIHW